MAKRLNIFGEEVKKKDKILGAVLLYVALYIIAVCAGVLSTTESKLILEEGGICEQTITAPYDFVDEYSTELLRQEAVQKVLPVYQTDTDVEAEDVSAVQKAFESLEKTRIAAKQAFLAVSLESEYTDFNPQAINWEVVLSQADVNNMLRTMPEYMLAQDVYVAAAMSQDDLALLKSEVTAAVTDAHEEGIVNDEKELAEAKTDILNKVRYTGRFSDAQLDTVESIVNNILRPNLIYDAEATELAKEQAAAAVEDVTYKKGENIVRQGERITKKQYEIILQLGLTTDENTAVPRWIAGAIIAGVIMLAWILYGLVSDRTLLTSTKKAFSVFLLSVLVIGIDLICKSISNWIVPVYLAGIVASALLRPRSALFYSVIISMLSTFIMSPSETFFFSESTILTMMAGVLGSTVAVLSLRDRLHRSEYILAGLIAGAINAMVYIAYGVLTDYSFTTYLYMSFIGLANGVVCGLLSVGVLPIWEAMFSLDTPSKLLEIASPDNELLKRMMAYAPGTYHHSVMVSNLAEAGAEAVGANALLARVGAFYHDVGKLYNPTMFAENQTGKNPHDDLSPAESARVIISHATYGKQFGEKFKLPKNVRDMIIQHHGTSLAAYFYITAKNKGMEVNEKDYRYPGPKPQTKEAGILMLADTTEAAVRSSKLTDLKEIQAMIRKLVKSKYDDGQLDECPLNRRELVQIEQAFLSVFERMNHERVAYPEEKKK